MQDTDQALNCLDQDIAETLSFARALELSAVNLQRLEADLSAIREVAQEAISDDPSHREAVLAAVAALLDAKRAEHLHSRQ